MPLNPKLKKVMVIGSGPIIIGQAAEFDYAGTQACRALKEEGLEVVLVNSILSLSPWTLSNESSLWKSRTAFCPLWADKPALLYPWSWLRRASLTLMELLFLVPIPKPLTGQRIASASSPRWSLFVNRLFLPSLRILWRVHSPLPDRRGIR